MNQFYKSIFLMFAGLWFSIDLNAQSQKTIRSDRPSQAILPFTVGKNNFQSQTGFEIGGAKYNYGDDYYQNRLVNTFLKFGASERLELIASFGYSKNWQKDYIGFNSYQGINDFSLGFRVNILDGKDYKPSLGLQFTGNIPISKRNPYTRDYIPKLILTLQQKITNKFNLTANIGVQKNEFIPNYTGLYVMNISYAITPKLSTFMEVYGEFYKRGFYDKWDTGLAFIVNDNLQLDIYGGVGFFTNNYTYFTCMGVSWKLGQKQN